MSKNHRKTGFESHYRPYTVFGHCEAYLAENGIIFNLFVFLKLPLLRKKKKKEKGKRKRKKKKEKGEEKNCSEDQRERAVRARSARDVRADEKNGSRPQSACASSDLPSGWISQARN